MIVADALLAPGECPKGGSGMSDVLQCPYCDLRFSTRSELEQHKAFDHIREQQEQAPASVEPDPEAAQRKTPVEKTSHVPEKRGFLSRIFKRS